MFKSCAHKVYNFFTPNLSLKVSKNRDMVKNFHPQQYKKYIQIQNKI